MPAYYSLFTNKGNLFLTERFSDLEDCVDELINICKDKVNNLDVQELKNFLYTCSPLLIEYDDVKDMYILQYELGDYLDFSIKNATPLTDFILKS